MINPLRKPCVAFRTFMQKNPSLSSTAFVLQLLAERGEFSTAHGRAAFAVLLLQDMMVVPLLALVPLLAPGTPDHADAAALP